MGIIQKLAEKLPKKVPKYVGLPTVVMVHFVLMKNGAILYLSNGNPAK
jgi:hypothetical protein